MEPNKNFKIVSNTKTRVILPNIHTLIGVCIGLSSIKFALDTNYGLAVIAIIFAASKGHLDDIEIEKVSEFESNLFDYLEANASDQLSSIKESGDLSDDTSKSLDKLISDFKNSFAA